MPGRARAQRRKKPASAAAASTPAKAPTAAAVAAAGPAAQMDPAEALALLQSTMQRLGGLSLPTEPARVDPPASTARAPAAANAAEDRPHANNDEDDDDDAPLTLSSYALEALQSFAQEQEAERERFAMLERQAQAKYDALVQPGATAAAATAAAPHVRVDMSLFREDWQLSQFWYDDATADQLAREAIAQCPPGGRIGCISSPSAFVGFERQPESDPAHAHFCRATVFEIDERFAVFGDRFVRYDFNRPRAVPPALVGQFDVLVVDPPFLSEACWTQTAETVRLLSHAATKWIINTGEVMTAFVEGLGTTKCAWRPRHSNALSNPFCCYTNFAPTVLLPDADADADADAPADADIQPTESGIQPTEADGGSP